MYSTFETHVSGTDKAHGALVAAIAAFLKPNLYVELGCFQGATFEMVEPYCGRAIAVDHVEDYRAFLDMRGLGHCFVCSDTLDFIAHLENESVDLCFLDSSHEEEATVREFHALVPKITKNGVVTFHDSYPPNQEYTQPGKCGGVWHAIERIQKENAFFEFVTLPSQFGVTIARKNFGKQLLWR